MDWNDLRFFLAVHRAGTLAAAARQLGVNATTVGRRLTTLEEQLRTPLFDRTPEGYVVTAIGRQLVEHAERIEAEVLAAERELAGADERVAGVVRVTATEMLATRFIAPFLPAFHERYPDVMLDLECTNRTVSLARREADIALRLARPREDDVVSKRLADIPLSLYASHGYVARRGRPAEPERSLDDHDVLAFAAAPPFHHENAWLEPRLGGARVVLRSDSVSSLYAATIAGLGLALLPRAVADRDPALVRLPTTTLPQPRTIWQTVHKDLRSSARVRAVMAFLSEILTPPQS